MMIEKKVSEFQSYKLTDGLLFLRDKSQERLAIPATMVPPIFKSCHDDSGHLGFAKSHARLHSYFIPRVTVRLRNYIAACPACSVVRNKKQNQGLLNPIQCEAECFHTVAMDFVTGLPAGKSEFDAILTITDKFSKVVTLILCSTTDTAIDTAGRFYSGFYSRYGLPQAIISDRDSKFISDFWRSLFALLKTSLLMSTAFHPQTDGLSERTNQTMENVLRTLVGYGVNEKWQERISEVEFYINTSKHAATGFAPYEVLYGYKPRTAMDSSLSSLANRANQAAVSSVEERRAMRQEVADAILDASATMARIHDLSRTDVHLNVGDKVYVEARPNLKIPGFDHGKIGAKRFGPFPIVRKVGTSAYQLKLPPNYKMHDVLNLQHLTKQVKDEYGRQHNEPPPIAIEGDIGEFVVEAVIDSRKHRGKKQYLAKFEGYSEAASEWYNEEDSASFSECVKEYEDRLRSGTVRPRPKNRKRKS